MQIINLEINRYLLFADDLNFCFADVYCQSKLLTVHISVCDKGV